MMVHQQAMPARADDGTVLAAMLVARVGAVEAQGPIRLGGSDLAGTEQRRGGQGGGAEP